MNHTRPGGPRFHLCLLVPIVLIAMCIALLSGCFYLPLPEHVVDQNQKDFRDMVGDAQSKKPIRPLAITRLFVTQSLGSPKYASLDDRVIAYVMNTETGAWVEPLCFKALPVHARVYVLKLEFDEHDVLAKWNLVKKDRGEYFFSAIPGDEESQLIEELSKDGPRLYSTQSDAAAEPVTRTSNRGPR